MSLKGKVVISIGVFGYTLNRTVLNRPVVRSRGLFSPRVSSSRLSFSSSRLFSMFTRLPRF